MLRRNALVFALLLPMACDFYSESPVDHCTASGGHWESRGCDGEERCYHDGPAYSSPGSYPPYAPDAGGKARCATSADCTGRGTCSNGVCRTDPARCIADEECTSGAACVEGRCGCDRDETCGDGFQCEMSSVVTYQSPVGSCVVCSDAGACTTPTCAPDGSCPGAMVCNESSVTCEIPTGRTACANDGACPNGMTCGSDRYCRQGATLDAGRDGATNASRDAADARSPADAAID